MDLRTTLRRVGASVACRPGPFLHNDPIDRPPAIFDGITTLHFSGARAPYLLLPIIPTKKQAGGKKRRK